MEALKRFLKLKEPTPNMHSGLVTMERVLAEPRTDEYKTPDFKLEDHISKLKSQLKVIDLVEVGHGGYGTVYMATDIKTKSRVAVKIERSKFTTLEYTKRWRNQANREAYILKELRGETNIVTFHEHIFMGATADKLPMYVAIKTEFLDQELGVVSKLRKLAWPQMLRVASQIGGAIAWMHDHGLVHHDIKPSNVMCSPLPSLEPSQLSRGFNSTTFKLIDFNLTRRYSAARDKAREVRSFGTISYMSLEKKRATPKTPYNPFTADDYAFGASMLCLLLGLTQYRNNRANPEIVGTMLYNEFADLSRLEQSKMSGVYMGLSQLLNEVETRITVRKALDMFDTE